MSTRPASMEPVIFTPQTVYCGDCLEILKHFPSETIDLVYIDPPFNSNRNYEMFWGDQQEKRAFDDRYGDAMAYINYMRPRVAEMYRVLKPTGSFYYHCDWHASHYIKMMLDELFGANNFQNEIVWKRTHAHGNVGRNFGNIADFIFFYSRGEDYCWNQQYRKISEQDTKQKYRQVDANGRRWQSVTLRNPSNRPNLHFPFSASNGVIYHPHPNGWSCNEERLKKYDQEDRLHFPAKEGGALRLKMYADESLGERHQNIWTDIPPIGAQAKERLGYPTQKPLELLKRIINTSSNEGDLVLDGFCGCGTTLVAAQQLGRKFVGIDISPTSSRVMGERLEVVCGMQPLPITENPIVLWGDIVGATPASPETSGSVGVPPVSGIPQRDAAATPDKGDRSKHGLAPTC